MNELNLVLSYVEYTLGKKAADMVALITNIANNNNIPIESMSATFLSNNRKRDAYLLDNNLKKVIKQALIDLNLITKNHHINVFIRSIHETSDKNLSEFIEKCKTRTYKKPINENDYTGIYYFYTQVNTELRGFNEYDKVNLLSTKIKIGDGIINLHKEGNKRCAVITKYMVERRIKMDVVFIDDSGKLYISTKLDKSVISNDRYMQFVIQFKDRAIGIGMQTFINRDHMVSKKVIFSRAPLDGRLLDDIFYEGEGSNGFVVGLAPMWYRQHFHGE